MEIVYLATCDCGFKLGIDKVLLEEAKIGVLGTINCPECGKRLNDKFDNPH